MFRKAAFKFVSQDGSDAIDVVPDNLKDFVGNPIFNSEKLYDVTPPGVCTGLAWTSMGEEAFQRNFAALIVHTVKPLKPATYNQPLFHSPIDKINTNCSSKPAILCQPATFSFLEAGWLGGFFCISELIFTKKCKLRIKFKLNWHILKLIIQ